MILTTIVVILSLDQLTKFFVTKNLSLHESVPLIKGVFHLTLVYNRGAAFGILKNQTLFFIITSLIAISLIYYQLKNNHHKEPLIYSFALSLILAGGIGNLIDRLFFGQVIDFLDFRVWPVFNIADSSITIGAVLLGWTILNSELKSKK